MYSIEGINDLVYEYQSNKDATSLEDLISAFDPFIRKWASIVSGSYINVQDPDISKFVALFGRTDMAQLYSLLHHVCNGLMTEDVYDEVLLVFIHKVINYSRDHGVGFQGYLKSTFRFDMYRWVCNRLKGPAIIYDSELYEELVHRMAAPPMGVAYTTILSDSTVLPCLSPKEKFILTLRYMDGVSTGDIAEIYGSSEATINSIVAIARAKLTAWLKESDPD